MSPLHQSRNLTMNDSVRMRNIVYYERDKRRADIFQTMSMRCVMYVCGRLSPSHPAIRTENPVILFAVAWSSIRTDHSDKPQSLLQITLALAC